MKDLRLNKLIKISLLSVIAFLIQYIEIPLPFFPEFLKIDASDIPALLGAFALGPVEGVIIELFKNIIHGLMGTKTAFVGELANFLVGGAMAFVVGYMYKYNKSRKTAIFALLIGSIFMSIIAGVLNYYVFLPLYQKVLHVPMEAFVQMGSAVNPAIKDLKTFILWSIVPFNLIKGIVVSAITLGVYKSVSPLIHNEAKKAARSN